MNIYSKETTNKILNKCRVNIHLNPNDICPFQENKHSLDKIINCFKKKDLGYFPDKWMISVKKQSSLENAIKMACSCRDEFGSIHPHSRRIQKKNLNQLSENLIKDIQRIKFIKDFHDLYCLFLENKVSGIGDLTMYDISLRLGYYLNVEPIYIYLHSCPLKSVKKLGILNKAKKIKNTNSLYLKREDLPKELKESNYNATNLEQFLCNCRDCFNYVEN